MDARRTKRNTERSTVRLFVRSVLCCASLPVVAARAEPEQACTAPGAGRFAESQGHSLRPESVATRTQYEACRPSLLSRTRTGGTTSSVVRWRGHALGPSQCLPSIWWAPRGPRELGPALCLWSADETVRLSNATKQQDLGCLPTWKLSCHLLAPVWPRGELGRAGLGWTRLESLDSAAANP